MQLCLVFQCVFEPNLEECAPFVSFIHNVRFYLSEVAADAPAIVLGQGVASDLP